MSQGCSIEKRRYLKGFHVTSNFFIGKEVQSDLDENANEDNEKRHALPEHGEMANLQTEQVVLEPNLEEITHLDETTVQIQEENSMKPIERRPVSLEKSRLMKVLKPVFKPIGGGAKESDNVDDEAEEKRWFPLLLGVFLGTVLALIVFPFAFLIIFFFPNLSSIDNFQFQTKFSDTPFKKGFKRAYNVVVKIAVLVLSILCLILFLAVSLIQLYLLYGWLGIILAIVLFILVMLLISFVVDRFMGFVFRDR